MDSSFTGDSGLWKEGSEDGHLFMGAQLGNLEWYKIMEAIPLCDIIKVYIFMSDTTIIHNSKYYIVQFDDFDRAS